MPEIPEDTSLEPTPQYNQTKTNPDELTLSDAKEYLPIIQGYTGLARHRFTDEQKKILLEPIQNDDLEVLPTGEVYASQVRYRRILNTAFGPGSWGLVPTSKPSKVGNTIMISYSLFVNGGFVSQSVGEHEYYENNPRTSYATALESCKSNALMRCCKDFGIASQCWDKRFTTGFKKEFCVQVWVKGKIQWRRKDAERFWNEGEKPPVKMPEQTSAKEATKVPASDQSEALKDQFVTVPQIKRLYTIAKDSGMDEFDMKDFLKTNFKIDSSKQLLKINYEAAIELIQGPASREPGQSG